MVVCTPCMGMGVRHVQYFLIAALITIDFWMQEISTKSFLRAISDSKYNQHALSPSEFKLVQEMMYLAFAVGRFMSGFASLKTNNKYLLICIVILEAIVATTCYWFALQMEFYGIAVITCCLSFTRSFHWTLAMNMLSKWMPPSEYTTSMAIIVITREVFSLMIRFFCDSFSFEMTRKVLFVTMTFYIVWSFLYLVIGAEGPDTSFMLSKVEHSHLAKHIGPRKRRYSAKAPWKAILGTTVLYGWVLADFGRECSVTVLADGFQLCLKNASGVASVAGIQAGTGLFFSAIIGASVLSDKLIVKEVLTPGQVRKIYSSVGCCGASISMILSAYSVKPKTRFAFVVVGHLFSAVMAIGQPTALFDISPNYAALMFAIFTFLRCLMFALKSFLDAFMGIFPMTARTYEDNFYRYGFVVFITNLIFLICGDIEKKPFDAYDTSDWTKESIISYP